MKTQQRPDARFLFIIPRIPVLVLIGLTLIGSSRSHAESRASVGKSELLQQAARCRALLKSSVVDFYLPACVDTVNGGYFEEQKDGKFAPSGQKFLTLQARQLWSFSTFAEEGIERSKSLSAAKAGFEFIERRMKDHGRGGYFSKVSDEGKPIDVRKHAYLNSFALYGLSAYYRVSHDKRALRSAKELFAVLEKRFHDSRNGGYQEFLHQDWTPITDPSESHYVGAHGTKTYNTHLHLLESFAELYRIWPDPAVAQRLQELILINTSSVLEPIYHCNLDGWTPEWSRIESPQNLRASYGHDVECAWLVLDAANTVGVGRPTLRSWAEALVNYSLMYGYDRGRGGFFYTGPFGQSSDDRKKEWWVQAEALVSMLTLYQQTGKAEYYEVFRQTLDFIEKHQIAEGGSWWATLNEDGSKGRNLSKTSMWQGAYHNGRALLWSARILEALAK